MFPKGLLRLQQYAFPLLLEGQSALVTGPPGSGKRTALWYATALYVHRVRAQQKQQESKEGKEEEVVSSLSTATKSHNSNAIALIVVASSDEGRRIRRLIESCFPTLRLSFTTAKEVDIVLLTSYSLQETTEKLLQQDRATANTPTTASSSNNSVSSSDWREITRLVVLCAERFTVPPLMHHLPLPWWAQFMSKLSPDCVVTMSCACHHRDVFALLAQLRYEAQQVQLLDYAAWTDVLHRVCYVEESMKRAFVAELLEKLLPQARPAVVLAGTKAEANALAEELRSYASLHNNVTTNTRTFYDSNSNNSSSSHSEEILVTTDWLFMEGIGCRPVKLVERSLAKRNVEETLATRVRMLPASSSQSCVLCGDADESSELCTDVVHGSRSSWRRLHRKCHTFAANGCSPCFGPLKGKSF